MLFIKDKIRTNNFYEVSYLKTKARTKALTHQMTSKEELLSTALQKQYGLNLRSCCVLLVEHATYGRNFSNQILINFLNPVHDTIAKAITYGIDEVEGSSILHDIFEES